MKHTNKKELNLNKSSVSCAPCLNIALKIEKRVNNRSLNEIKINEIKEIVNSIFESSNNDIKKN